jgi:hypothetical protein
VAAGLTISVVSQVDDLAGLPITVVSQVDLAPAQALTRAQAPAALSTSYVARS